MLNFWYFSIIFSFKFSQSLKLDIFRRSLLSLIIPKLSEQDHWNSFERIFPLFWLKKKLPSTIFRHSFSTVIREYHKIGFVFFSLALWKVFLRAYGLNFHQRKIMCRKFNRIRQGFKFWTLSATLCEHFSRLFLACFSSSALWRSFLIDSYFYSCPRKES